MTNFKIIRDSKKLNESLSKQKTKRDEYQRLLHVNAVSVLVRANETGGINEINRFHNLLNANEQTAFRNYVRKFQETGVKDENGKPILTEYAFLMFKGGEWRIDTSTPVAQRQPGSPFQKYAEETLINPDGKTTKPFYEQDNVSDINLFDDKSVLDSIKRLLTTVNNGSTDKREVKVSDEVASFLKDVVGKADTLASKLNVEERHKSNVVQLHARPHEKPENTEAAQSKRADPVPAEDSSKHAERAPARKRGTGRPRANAAAKQAATG